MNTHAPIFIIEVDGRELGEDISQNITSFSYEDHEDKMDELKFSIAHGGFDFIDDGQIQEGKSVRARWGYIGDLSEPRSCTIKEIAYTFGEDGVARMDVTAFDKGHKLTGRAARTCWKNKTIAEIVKDVAKKHNLTPKVKIEEDAPQEFIAQGGKSDMIFLKGLAINTGCSMWVTNDELHFEPNEVGEPVRVFRWREDKDGYLQSFKVTAKAEQGKGAKSATEMSGLDPLTKKPIRETVGTSASGKGGETRAISLNTLQEVPKQASNSGGDLNDNSSRQETPKQQRNDEAGVVVPTPEATAAQARRSGKGKVGTTVMKSIEATATTIGLPYLKAKDTVTIENVGKKFSGDWRIKSVRHEIRRDSYMCSLTLAKSNYKGKGGKAAGTAPKTVKNNATAAEAGEKKPSKGTQSWSLNTRSRVK